MPDFLDHWVKRPNDQIGKNWVAKALILAFPDPSISSEFTHARAALAPIYHSLLLRERQCARQVLDPQGWKREQPFLALAATVANDGFIHAAGSDGRRMLFQALVEIIAHHPGSTGHRGLSEFAHALRIELEDLAKNPTSRPPNPDFQTVWEAIPWFGQQLERYSDAATTAWRRQVSGLLRQALLDPAPPPGISSEEDKDIGGNVVVIAPSGTDSELEDDKVQPGIPPSYWLLPENEFGPLAGVDEDIRTEVLGASISTYIPSGRFTEASPTYLTDEQATAEAGQLMAGAIRAREGQDPESQRQLLAKALSLATSTPVRYLEMLHWGRPSQEVVRGFPGLLAPSGRWLYRPEFELKEGRLERDQWVQIPIPEILARELQALRTQLTDAGLVFPTGKSPLGGGDRIRDTERATSTQLQRALVCRLVSNKRWGPSAAQYVAGDDLGIDRAPLHYDRISAADLAIWVSAITAPWFGEAPGRLEGSLPTHFVGSRRIPEVAAIRKVLVQIREEWDASPKTLACRIRHRTRNLVHGLCLTTGHRPNDKITEITRRDIGEDDLVAIILDKAVGPDWPHRPVALEPRWVDEYRALLSDLTRAVDVHAQTALGKQSRLALEGQGPIFLAVKSLDDVRPFGLQDYLEGLPPELTKQANFARQFLNNELSTQLPEFLRVAQMGWHGTRAGAFVDGSPWSVRTACATISPKLASVLKAVGWRPLEKTEPGATLPMPPFSWAQVETQHECQFKERVSECKVAASERRARVVDVLRPKMKAMLEPIGSRPSLGLVLEGDQLHLAPGQEAPVHLAAEWSENVIRRLAGGDPRSLEAHAARSWIRDLVVDGRKREVIAGTIPRRSVERWPNNAAPFLRYSPTAFRVAREIDALISQGAASRALKTVVTLLLHGGYADLSAAISVMRSSSRLSSLRSKPSVLIVEPAEAASEDEGSDAGSLRPWRHGALAFHGLAAVALRYWHKSAQVAVDIKALDVELGVLASTKMACREATTTPFPWLHELESLARVLNTLRMDGIARLVGTGRVVPASAPIERIVALRDGLPMGSRSAVVASDFSLPLTGATKERQHRVHGLADQVIAAIGQAVEQYEADRKKQTSIRKGLETKLRQWIGAAKDYRPEELIALYALLLLTRGGRRRKVLELSTIQGYVYAVARPLMASLPSDPMRAESDDWTQSFLAACAMAETTHRPNRADALANFHWVLSQAMTIPAVDLGEMFAFAGRAAYMADAGFLTGAELQSLGWALGEAVESARSQDASRRDIHTAQHRKLLAQLAFSGALRPGEAACLSFRNLPRPGDGRLRVSKNRFQNLKNVNARRCPRLMPEGFGIAAPRLQHAAEAAKLVLASRFSLAMPLFHELDDPESRIDDRQLFAGLSALLKWSTGELDASPYWLRKAAIRHRLEYALSETPGSLQTISSLLAEVGHADVRTTLGSYTHDPVTPFLRWFNDSWLGIDASRIADAAGRARDVVSRRRGGLRLADSHVRVTARIGELLADTPYLGQLPAAGSIALPSAVVDGCDAPSSLRATDVDAALSLLASGFPAAAGAASDWPKSQKEGLKAALLHLEDDHYIQVSAEPVETGADSLCLTPPRRLSDDAGLRALLEDAGATSVLTEMFEAWLSGLGYGVARSKIVAAPAQWARWLSCVPVLAALGWEVSPQGRAKEARVLPARGGGQLGLWPTLRWVMACAWLHSKCMALEPGEREDQQLPLDKE